MSMDIEIPSSRGKARDREMTEFARVLIVVDRETGFKVSSRGWCYQLENLLVITKADFNRVQNLINQMRKLGFLPIDFTAQDASRQWASLEFPTSGTPVEYLGTFLKACTKIYDYYTPNWWDGEKYYVQMMVEKIDLKTLFLPVCEKYHIPISTAKGWSDINQRAEMAARFKEAEEKGLKPILLYAGDFDPFGVNISETLLKNMWQIAGGTGWEPENLVVDRFGLNFEFIEENELSWIENLKTSAKPPKINDLADPRHPQHYLPFVQEWLENIGPRKVEANALVVAPAAGRQLCKESIERWLGTDALSRFQAKRDEIRRQIEEFDADVGVMDAIQEALELIPDAEE